MWQRGTRKIFRAFANPVRIGLGLKPGNAAHWCVGLQVGWTVDADFIPVALVIAALAYVLSGDPVRFLSVLVIATPCPLLIGIPTALMGSISLAARNSIVIRDTVGSEGICPADSSK